jgi:hypothetical protein
LGGPRKTWAIASVISSASLILAGAPGPLALGQEVVHQHINCRDKGVEVGAHVASLVDVAVATPNFGALCHASSPAGGNSESII